MQITVRASMYFVNKMSHFYVNSPMNYNLQSMAQRTFLSYSEFILESSLFCWDPNTSVTSSFSLEALLIFLFSLQIRLFWSCIIYTLVENPISVENGPFFTDFMWVKILIPLCGGLLFEVEKVSDLRYHHWVLCSVGYCHLQLFAGLLVQLLRLN